MKEQEKEFVHAMENMADADEASYLMKKTDEVLAKIKALSTEISRMAGEIEKVMKEYVSIAAAGGEDGADRIRITKAKLQMNEYYGSPDKLISFPRINTFFVTRIK